MLCGRVNACGAALPRIGSMRSMSSRLTTRLLFLSAMATGWLGVAHASATSGDSNQAGAMEAQRLFDEALSLLDKNQAEHACPKLERSLQLDPGIGTQFQLADCYERLGKRATAYRLFDEVASRCAALGATEHAQLALQRKAALESQLQYLALEIQLPLDGLDLSLDQRPIPREKWADRLPVDPGVHNFVARAPGYAPLTGTVTVLAGTRVTTLGIGPVAAPTSGPGNALARVSQPTGTVDPIGQTNRADRYRTLGYVTTGIGVAGLAVGGVFGLVALSKKHDSDAQCHDQNNGQTCDSRTAQDLHNAAVVAGNYSTAFFVAGSIVTATGVTLLLTLPNKKPSTLNAGVGFAPHGAFARLGGDF